MKNLREIVKNKVTRHAILYTLLILFIYRIGSYVIAPGINADSLLKIQQSLSSQLTTLFNFFGGGSLGQMSLFALGVSPYITASIIIQLLESDLVPAMTEWKHQGVDGQNKRSNWTKRLAIALAFVQAIGIVFGFYATTGELIVSNHNFVLVALIMTAGTSLLVWLGDRITEKGIGNGISVMIMAGILASMPSQLSSIYGLIKDASGIEAYKELLVWLIVGIILLLVVIIVIYYSLAYRKIQINYVRSGQGKLRKNSYLPIKLNPAGVIPVIFVSPLMLIMSLAMNAIFNNVDRFVSNGHGALEAWALSFVSFSAGHWVLTTVVFMTLIIVFSIFYSYVQMNPENMTESLERQNAYIVGVRPGKDTEEYLSNVILKTSIWGGLILAFLAALPYILSSVGNLQVNVSLFGTGLIIVVSVFVQTYQSLTNKVESKKYRRLLGEK